MTLRQGGLFILFKSMEILRQEEQERAKIMRVARKLMCIIDQPVLLILKDDRGRLTLLENSQPFNNVIDFSFEDS